jgi:hypothetical protein
MAWLRIDFSLLSTGKSDVIGRNLILVVRRTSTVLEALRI